MVLGKVAEVNQYHAYSYEHLDDLSFARKPEDILEFETLEELAKFKAAVKDKLRAAGWEGDGELSVIWFPPFVDIGVEDTWGTYVWLVKQSNNGTTWLLSESPLNFERLRIQNRDWPGENYHLVGCLYTECESFISKIKSTLASLDERLSALRSVDNPIFGSIEEELLTSAQGEFVAQFGYFLDDCYLSLLEEIIDGGNQSGLKLQRFKATLSPTKYLPFDEEQPYDEDAVQWVTIKGMIGDMWRSFQFEPFQQKIEMVFKTSEYSLDEITKTEIKKHIQLRNCVEHHDGQLTAESLQNSGGKIYLLNGNGQREELSAWATIKFSEPELIHLGKKLMELAIAFYQHTRTRIKARHGINRRNVLLVELEDRK